MARKTTGSTSLRNKKTDLNTENTALPPSAVQVTHEPQKIATVATNGGNGEKKRTANLDEEIRHRAYELYLERNGAAGDPSWDWLTAEREVRARHATAGHSA